MELFYSRNIAAGELFLDENESGHCVKVLRHKVGDAIHVVDGSGCLYSCRIVSAAPRRVDFTIEEIIEGYGSHPYYLHMAVAPPKNIDRFEWFVEKATEIGVDCITPLFGDYSERKVFKKERCERIIVSAAKQSHKGAIPSMEDAATVRTFLQRDFGQCRKLICYCDDTSHLGVQKLPLTECLAGEQFVVMIGPEGDFSREEMEIAVAAGWQPVSLGSSRLRIETAALVATSCVYGSFFEK